MIVLANILGGIALVLDMILFLAIILVIARAVISWVNPDPFNPIVRFLRGATDPLLLPLQRRLPLIAGGLDLSPLVLLFGLYFIDHVVVGILQGYAESLLQQAIYGPR